MSKAKLSLALVVKNEAAILERCLESVKDVVDEIVIVDTGSTDKTLEIAQKYTKHIYHFEWIDDFSAAYNYCISKTHFEFILKWDADFILSSESQSSLIALKENDFEKANHIYLRLQNIEPGSAKASGSALRELIFNKKDFYYVSPVHMFLQLKSSSINKEKLCQNIVVNHHKDLAIKKFRLSQSYKIIQKYLKSEPNNTYLFYHMILGHVYSEEYKEALEKINYFLVEWPDYIPERVITLLQKKFECLLKLGKANQTSDMLNDLLTLKDYPQAILLQADIFALNDSNQAIALYKEYLSKNFLPINTHYGYHYYRNIVHPRIMLARLVLKDNPELAKKYIHELADFDEYIQLTQEELKSIVSEVGIEL